MTSAEYHPPQWVDCSGPAYKRAARPSSLFLLSLSPRTARGEKEMKTGIPVPWVGFGKQSISLCRLSMNNPPTARGWDFREF
jgi:hypothetical protein